MGLRKNKYWDQVTPKISVVMLGHKKVDLLLAAITSLRTQYLGPTEKWELVLVLNGASSEVTTRAHSLLDSENYSICLLEIPAARPGAARNQGVLAARGELILFLDDDTEAFQDMIGNTLELFQDPRLIAAGGANLTPPNSSGLARATGYTLASWWGAGLMSQRYRVGKEHTADEHALILCNLAIRRNAFEKNGGFVSFLVSNEENVLLQRLTEKSLKLLHSPKLAIFHHRRNNLSGLWEQMGKYGMGRAQNILLLPHSANPMYFLPATFLAYLGSLPLLLFVFGPGALSPLGVHLSLSFLFFCSAAITRRDPATIWMIALYPLVHIGYGWGFLKEVSASTKKIRVFTTHQDKISR